MLNKNGDKHMITDEVLRLIGQTISDARGSRAAFCRMTGITSYNLSKILSGNKKYVFGDDWNRLCEFIPELDNNRRRRISRQAQGQAQDPLLVDIMDNWQYLEPRQQGEVAGIVRAYAQNKKDCGGSDCDCSEAAGI